MTINKHSKGRGKGKQPKRREHTMEKSQTIIGHGNDNKQALRFWESGKREQSQTSEKQEMQRSRQ